MDADKTPATKPARRIQLTRDIILFQVKLLVDGVRDLVLVPVSIVAGIVSLISAGSKEDAAFYDVLRLGRKSEHMINLFGAADREEATGSPSTRPTPADIDELVSRVEAFIVDGYRSGEITGHARERLDRALESLRAKRKPPA